jgi:hypothetical protein
MADRREHRDALERRIWRLAFLLTGDPAGAAALVDRILDAQPHPEKLDPAHLDRLVIQQAREMGRATKAPGSIAHARGDAPPLDPVAQRALTAALTMPHQPLEAWVLVRVDEVDELRMSRAMDCSRTAARNHLAAGDEQMRSKLGGDLDAGVAALRAMADSLDPGPIIAAHRVLRKKQRRRRVGVVSAVVAIVVLAGFLVVLKGWLR